MAERGCSSKVNNNVDIRYRRFPAAVFRLYALVFLTLVLSGCVILPYPTKVESLPFDDERLSRIVPGETSRQAVTDLLGEADLEGPGSTIALYAERRQVAGFVGVTSTSMGARPLRTKHILVISYDETGTVRFVDIFRHGLVGGGSEICASSGICMNPRIWQTDDEYAISDAIFYDLPEKDADAKSFDVPLDRCAVYVYLDTNFFASGKVSVHSIGHAGSQVQLDESGYIGWLHDPAFVKIGVSNLMDHNNAYSAPPPEQQFDSGIELDCQVGRVYFIKVKQRWDWGDARHSLDLTVEKHSQGRAAIRKRRLVLGHT